MLWHMKVTLPQWCCKRSVHFSPPSPKTLRFETKRTKRGKNKWVKYHNIGRTTNGDSTPLIQRIPGVFCYKRNEQYLVHLQRWDGADTTALLQRGQQTNQIKGSVGWMQEVFVSTWRMFGLISKVCFAGWAAALIWVTSIRQGRMERSVLTAERALMISCEGHRGGAPWSESDCTWAAPVRTAGLQNGTCGDTRACLALRNSWTNVIGGNRARFSVGEVGWIGLMESQNATWHSGKSLRDSNRSW